MKSVTHGVVTIDGQQIPYDATAGTIVLKDEELKPTASIFYVAYTKSGVKDPSTRPITFIYNGGPGSSTVWLHMGALGRSGWRPTTKILAPGGGALQAGGYPDFCLLDASDLVFIDMPGTGFGRLTGKDLGDKAFWGISTTRTAHAFGRFIQRFPLQIQPLEFAEVPVRRELRDHAVGGACLEHAGERLQHRSERGDAAVADLQLQLHGHRRRAHKPGVDMTYELALPTYAATAWYHHKLPQQASPICRHCLRRWRRLLTGPCMPRRWRRAPNPSAPEKQSVAQKLPQYTGLPASYW